MLKLKSPYPQIIKGLITVSLLGYVLTKVNYGEFTEVIRAISIWHIVLLFIFTILQSMFNNKAWQFSLKAFNIGINYFRLFFYYYIGAFYSLTLPGTIGGDAVKIYLVGRKTNHPYREVFSALLVQRGIGLLVFIMLFAIPASLFSDVLENTESKIIFSAFLALIVLVSVFVYLNKRCMNIVLRILDKITFKKLNEKLTRLISSVYIFRDKKHILIRLIATSVLVYLTSLTLRYVVYLSLGLEIELIHFFSIVIIVSMLVQLPISFAGIGIREGSYVFFFAKLGIEPEIALIFSMLEFFPGLLINLSAGLLYSVSEFRKSASSIKKSNIKKELKNGY